VTNTEYLTVPEIAAEQGCREETVRRWIHAGLNGVQLRAMLKPNGEYRVQRGDLEAFLAPVPMGGDA
jgi:predicted site-specific integrase-resolvase